MKKKKERKMLLLDQCEFYEEIFSFPWLNGLVSNTVVPHPVGFIEKRHENVDRY